jgi:hypothetical protein
VGIHHSFTTYAVRDRATAICLEPHRSASGPRIIRTPRGGSHTWAGNRARWFGVAKKGPGRCLSPGSEFRCQL